MSENLVLKKENIITHKKTGISKEYTLGKILGNGAFGQVRLGIHKTTKQVRALKILKKAKINMDDLLTEISILSKLSHPNIMQVYEIFEDNINLYIVTEYCKGGELFDIISKKGSFSEKEAAEIMQQILSAVCYAHQNGIVHRDLKPENILMDNKNKKSDLSLKIIDWGSAALFDKQERLHTTDGTSYYIAPEVLQGDYDQKCDIWSCGVILYILLCGYAPFYGDTDEEIYQQVLKGEYDFPKEEWDHVSKEAKNLVKKMIEKNPEKRVSALEALQDVWFKNNKQKKKADKVLAKNVLQNMKKFKKNKKFEKATISFIINQLVLKDERNDLERQFKEWDTNGDGVLSRDEIIQGYKKTYGKVDENEIDNMINSIDLDGNGVIDYHEFLSCAMSKEKILRNENLEICFKAFDLDNSGSISLDEISAIFKKGGKDDENAEAFKNIMKEADENGDGEISFTEFKNLMRKFFL